MEFETRAIHAGQEPEPAYGAVNVPIYQTSTYAQSAVGAHKGYDYARTANPTRPAVETPTNPLLRVVDLGAVAAIAHEAGAWLVVDNTFASPYLQQPIALGADFVTHSATKYLGGHSDVVGGALVTTDAEVHERLKFLQNAAGAVPGPLDCFLVLRGLKTLAVRMEAHSRNAQRVAEFLSSHRKVTQVYYPGLPSHPGHEVAKRQMRGFSGMVSFDMDT